MRVYGYQFYVDGELAAWSETFYPTREEVREDMQRNVRKICLDISGNAMDSGFAWNVQFDPGDPASCYDEKEFNDCLDSYNRVRNMVAASGCSQIREMVTNAVNEWENNCPYEISWHILPYKVAVPRMVFGQIIALDLGDEGEYRMPHLTAAYPDTPESRQQVIEDLAHFLRDTDEIDQDKFRASLETAGSARWRNNHGDVITIYEANILSTECNVPEQDEENEEEEEQ